MGDPEILDITDADLLAKFQTGVANVAAMSLAINYPTVASVPHSVVNGMKTCWRLLQPPRSPSRRLRPSKPSWLIPAPLPPWPRQLPQLLLLLLQQLLPPPKEESEEEDDDMGFGLFD